MNTTAQKANQVIVHKEGEEGVIAIDRATGRLLTPLDERPEWTEGLATALVAERLDFYQKRLGDGTTFQQIADAAAIEYSDLGWIGVNADGDEIELEANPDYRMDLVANGLGVNRETGDITGTVLAEHEVSRDNGTRTGDEMRALETSVETGFGTAQDAGEKRETGTN